MPDLKISQLPAALTPLAGTELVPVVQGGITERTTVGDLLTSTVPSGTANGVMYLNGSKTATSGSALTFNGTNLGLGVTPSSWGSNFKAIESAASSTFAIAGANINGMSVLSNAYADNSNWRYTTTGTASRYAINTNIHQWFVAPSGTAGDVISFTQAMTLNSSGNLGIGTTSPSSKLVVSNSGAAGLEISPVLRDGTTVGASVLSYNRSGAAFVPMQFSGSDFRFATSDSEQMRLTSTGLGIGTSSPGYKLSINDSTGTGLGFSNAASGNFNLGLLAGSGSSDAYVFQRANGPLIIGTNNTERARIDSSGNFIHQVNGTAPSLSTNSTMSFELTSNTSLKIVVRGTDGVTRSATLTLA